MRGILLTAAAGALIVSSSALAAIDVLFCQVAGNSKALVPPGSGLPGTTEFFFVTQTGFDRPFASPDGTKVFFTGRAGAPAVAADDECFVVLNGATATTVAREGTLIGSPDANFVGPGPQRMGINDAGQFVFGYNTASATVNDDYIVKYDGANFIAAVVEGQPVPTIAGEALGSTLQSPNILADGTVAYAAGSTVGALGTTQDDFLIVGNTVLVQHGVTPIGSFLWDVFNTSDFWVTHDNAHWLMVGDDTNPTTTEDKIVVVDNAVVVREGQVLPGSGFTSPVASALSATYEITMCNDGAWLLRSRNVDGEDWVVRNGTILATTDDPIVPASAELFDDAPFADCFFFIAGNAVGDYVVGGVTNAADLNANAVLVLNGTDVVVREGDMVDLNGNGLADDDAFVSVFNNDDGVLTDDLRLVFFADIRNAALTSLGQAVLSIDLAPAPCPADIDGSNSVDVNDLLAVITTWGVCPGCPPATCPGDISPAGGDCNIDVNDLLLVITTWGPCP